MSQTFDIFAEIQQRFTPGPAVKLEPCENCGQKTSVGLCPFCMECESLEMQLDDQDICRGTFEVEIQKLERQYGRKYIAR